MEIILQNSQKAGHSTAQLTGDFLWKEEDA
jgi:hypothetical protein